jgi:hypothetical protein
MWIVLRLILISFVMVGFLLAQKIIALLESIGNRSTKTADGVENSETAATIQSNTKAEND